MDIEAGVIVLLDLAAFSECISDCQQLPSSDINTTSGIENDGWANKQMDGSNGSVGMR